MAQLGVDGRFVRVNPALCHMVGYRAEQLLAMTSADISHPDDAEAARKAMAQVAADQATQFRAEYRYRHTQDRIGWCAVSAVAVHDADGQVEHILVHYLDISELKRVEAELQQLAVHDTLTGLLNRRGFEDSMAAHVARVER